MLKTPTSLFDKVTHKIARWVARPTECKILAIMEGQERGLSAQQIQGRLHTRFSKSIRMHGQFGLCDIMGRLRAEGQIVLLGSEDSPAPKNPTREYFVLPRYAPQSKKAA